jgi:hypothetical protein
MINSTVLLKIRIRRAIEQVDEGMLSRIWADIDCLRDISFVKKGLQIEFDYLFSHLV